MGASHCVDSQQASCGYKSQGKYEEAKRLYEDCLKRRRKVLGDDHEDTLNTMYNLAINYNDQCRYEEAKRLYEDCLARQRKVLGDDHPSTLRTMHYLSRISNIYFKYFDNYG